MSASVPPFSVSRLFAACRRDEGNPTQLLSKSELDQRRMSRRWFRDLLWRAFPAASEHAVALRAAPVLGRTPRQVRNWLRCENDAPVTVVMIVLAVAGAEVVFKKIEADE